MNSDFLDKYLKDLESHRTEAIYNYSYKYIKEIIWDDEKNEKYGDSRLGYDKFRKDVRTSVSYSGVTSLREITIDNGIVGYISETKNQINYPLLEISEIWKSAREEFIRELGATDTRAIDFWLDDKIYIDYTEANSYRSAIMELKDIIKDYNYDEDFRFFIDKLVKN